MKKFIKIITISLVCFLSFAFSSKAQWVESFEKGDELKGTTDHYSFIYMGTKEENYDGFGYYTNNRIAVVTCQKGIIDYQIYEEYRYATAIIGFYENGELKNKKKESFFVGNRGNSGWFSEKTSAQIIDFLKNKGDVRIIISKYGGGDYDVIIPMNRNLK